MNQLKGFVYEKSWLRLIGLSTIVTMLTGCDPLLVLDPKGPQAQVQAKDIMLSIGLCPLSYSSYLYC